MAVTDQQAATLRTQLAGDTAEYLRLAADLDDAADRVGYTALIAAAFVVAAERRFSADDEDADFVEDDVVEFVADVRGRVPGAVDQIDPSTAERLILAAISDGSIEDIDADTAVVTSLMLLAALVGEARYDDAGLDAFMARARALADRWTD